MFATKKYKQLLKRYQQQLKITEHMHDYKRRYEELGRFITALNERCDVLGCRICGFKKLEATDGSVFYMGYLVSVPHETSPRHSYTYDIYGFRCPDAKHFVYHAYLKQTLSPVPAELQNTLFLGGNFIDKMYRGQGIGSDGMSIIKKLAYQLHCSKIIGERIPDDSEKEIALQRFYEKQGFAQYPGSRRIEFSLEHYTPSDTTDSQNHAPGVMSGFQNNT